MKKIRYLLSVFLVVCLMLLSTVSAVDLKYLGVYVDPSGKNRNQQEKDEDGNLYPDIYIYTSVQRYLYRAETNGWVDTYPYLNNNTTAWISRTSDAIRNCAINEAEELNGTLGSYNTIDINFTGLVEKDNIFNSKTTSYDINPKKAETNDMGSSNANKGYFKVAYDNVAGGARDIAVPMPDGSIFTVNVTSDVINQNFKFVDASFTPVVAYVDTNAFVSDENNLANSNYRINFPLKKSVATREGAGFKYYLTKVTADTHENIDILTSAGLKRIVEEYANAYGMSKDEVLNSIGNTENGGLRFSSSISTEAYHNLTQSGCWVTTSGIANLPGNTSTNAKFNTGSTAIYALQWGTGFSSNNTGFNDNGGWGYSTDSPNYLPYMRKTKTKVQASVLNNYDNIIYVPMAKTSARLYVKYYRKAWNLKEQKYENEVRNVAWGKTNLTKVIKTIDNSQMAYAENDEYISESANDELFKLSVDESNTKDNYEIDIANKAVYTDSKTGKNVNYVLDLENTKYVVNMDISKATEYINSNMSTNNIQNNKFKVSLKDAEVMILKVVYKESPEKLSKLLIQYRTQDWDKTTRKFKASKINAELKNLDLTEILDIETNETLQNEEINSKNVSSFEAAILPRIFHEMYSIAIGEYKVTFDKTMTYNNKQYDLYLGETYFVHNKNLLDIYSIVESNRMTSKITQNPYLYNFKDLEHAGIVVTYRENPGQLPTQNAQYITLKGLDLEGTLQFISVTNTRDFNEDGSGYTQFSQIRNSGDMSFKVQDTLASNVLNNRGTLQAVNKNNSVDGQSLENLLSRFRFFKSTYTEGRTNSVSSSNAIMYDFVPSGEYISPYMTGAYSYIVRGMTWKVNERTYDIVNHEIEVKRSFMYIMRWAQDGHLPGFTHSKVKNDLFKFYFNRYESNRTINYYYNENGSRISGLKTKGIFTKYWEVNDGRVGGIVCPYRTSERSAYSDHYHKSSCCPGMHYPDGRSEFKMNTLKFAITIDCSSDMGGIESDTHTWSYEERYVDHYESVETPSSDPNLPPTVTLKPVYYWSSETTSVTVSRRYGSPGPTPSCPVSEGEDIRGISYEGSEENECGGSRTYKYQNRELSINYLDCGHSTSQVQNGFCKDESGRGDNNTTLSCTGSATVSDVKKCPNYSCCGEYLSGTKTSSGTVMADHDDGVECNWNKFYSRDKHLDGTSNSYIELYKGHYHDEKCFITYYDNSSLFLESTNGWYNQYLNRIKPDSSGHIYNEKESGIEDKDLYVGGMDPETFRIFKNSGILKGFAQSRRDYSKSIRDYSGTYTLKYYTIENFMLYKIKDMYIYDKSNDGNKLGNETFAGNKIVVPTSENYDKLFSNNANENTNGLYSNSKAYLNSNFVKVNWGEDEEWKKISRAEVGRRANEVLNLDTPRQDKTYVGKINSDPQNRNYTFGQIVTRPSTYYSSGSLKIYPYVGADGKNNAYADSFTNYRNWEDSYVFLSDSSGYSSALGLENLSHKSANAITDTEVALRIGVSYKVADFYNDYFKFSKNYGENVSYLSHHDNYTDNGTSTYSSLLNPNLNWASEVKYNYTWQKGMEVSGYNKVKSRQKLFNDRSFLSVQAKYEPLEINSSNKEENELKKLFDATNFTNRNNNEVKRLANGNKIITNNNGESVRGIRGTYLTGENPRSTNSSSYIYTKNYNKYTDNSKNDKVTDIYDWSLINLPISVLYDNDNGVGNGKREFEYTIEYELVTVGTKISNGRVTDRLGVLYKNSNETDCYTNYTQQGVTTWKRPDLSLYSQSWIEDDLKLTDYTNKPIKTTSNKVWTEPDGKKPHTVETSVHIYDDNFTGVSGIDLAGNMYNKTIESLRFNRQDSYLNVLSPVSIKTFWLETADLVNHITTSNNIKDVLGKNTKFTLHFKSDSSTADVGYGVVNNMSTYASTPIYTKKYTKEYWIQCDFDLWCDRCQVHPRGGYHPAFEIIRVNPEEEYFNGRTTGTYEDPAVGTDENMVKILAISNNIPTDVADYVAKNDVGNGQYLFEDENRNTFISRQTGRQNQVRGSSRLSLYTLSGARRLTMDDAYHVAYKEFESDSIFRIFGFEITDFTDLLYKPVFRNGTNMLKDNYYTGRFEWVYEIVKYGELISGDALSTSTYTVDRFENDRTKTLTLPVGPYSNLNKGYTYAPKLGYTFSFNVKTTGYLPNANKEDTRIVHITPTYYYISKDGKTYDNSVDLYYKNAEGIYTKFVDSGYNIAFKPNDGYRNLRFIDDTDYSTNLLSSELLYIDISSSKGFDLDSRFMTTSYTNFIQTWYGEFKLPNSTIAVNSNNDNGNKHRDLNDPYIDGYIGIKFDITCSDSQSNQKADYMKNDDDLYRGKDKDGNDLTNPTSKANTSQWDYEGNFGFNNVGSSFTSFPYTLEKGSWNITSAQWNTDRVKSTVVLYDTDLRAEDDFE